MGKVPLPMCLNAKTRKIDYYCQKCKTKLIMGRTFAKYCWECGTRIDWEAAEEDDLPAESMALIDDAIKQELPQESILAITKNELIKVLDREFRKRDALDEEYYKKRGY